MEKQNRSYLKNPRGVFIVSERPIWYCVAACFYGAFIVYQFVCLRIYTISSPFITMLLALLSLTAGTFYLLKAYRRKAIFETNFNSLTYTPAIGKPMQVSLKDIEGFYAYPGQRGIKVVNTDRHVVCTLDGNMNGMDKLFRMIKGKPFYHEDSYKKEENVKTAMRMQALFISFSVITMFVSIASFMCSILVVYYVMFFASVIALVLFVLCNKYFDVQTYQHIRFPEGILDFIGMAYIIIVSRSNIQIDWFFISLLLFIIGIVFSAGLYAGMHMHSNAIGKVIFIVVFSIVVSNGANYLFADSTVIPVRVVDKYEVTVRNDHSSSLVVLDESGQLINTPITVSIETYNRTEIGDVIDLVKKESIFAVVSYYDQEMENVTTNRIIFGKREICIFTVAIAIGIIVSVAFITGHALKLFIITIAFGILCSILYCFLFRKSLKLGLTIIGIILIPLIAFAIWIFIPEKHNK